MKTNILITSPVALMLLLGCNSTNTTSNSTTQGSSTTPNNTTQEPNKTSNNTTKESEEILKDNTTSSNTTQGSKEILNGNTFYYTETCAPGDYYKNIFANTSVEELEYDNNQLVDATTIPVKYIDNKINIYEDACIVKEVANTITLDCTNNTELYTLYKTLDSLQEEGCSSQIQNLTEVSQMVGLYDASYNHGYENIGYRYINTNGDILYLNYLGDEAGEVEGDHRDCYTQYLEGNIVNQGNGEFIMHHDIITYSVTVVKYDNNLIFYESDGSEWEWEKVHHDINVINSKLCN